MFLGAFLDRLVKYMNKDYIGVCVRKMRERTNPWFSGSRRNELCRTSFTIISNNCWAGTVYRYFGLPYLSPTVGLYFFASDYVKFASNLRHYINTPLRFISSSESRYAEELVRRGEQNKVIARLDDIEVVFLHYSTPQEAKEKWERRCARINWNNLFIKFSEMNECEEADIKAFDSIDFPNKICLMSHPRPEIKCGIYFPGVISGIGQIVNDTDRFQRGFSVTEWLNNSAAIYSL